MWNWLTGQISALLYELFRFTGSYGWAIILLTIVIKAALHPLTRKQLKSMKEMQKLAPLLQSLQRKHKEDPQQLNREMMDLYRAHGVNPLSGCLPMVLQMPILFALYNVLSHTANFRSLQGEPLKNIPFLPWDLLVHPMTVISEIGKFGIYGAAFYAAIPVLIAGSTWMQQKVSVTDPSQARMFVFMPFLIGYFSLNFPVGLSLYWFTSTMAYVAEYLLVVGLPGSAPKASPAPPAPEEPRPKPTEHRERAAGTTRRKSKGK